ncbi:MAG: hypothetical protein HWQ38_01755 [Nostoc sp. NMS7]|uniref:hypothetical protein n=1 Tax=Nostoc sp. NMS7 TaxID=2815391 RepID=UPI0025D66497|nr:hypothetical protein [Nostoc sp. NMS7]MBN3945269.1 hypothetical protein [Nostoc sp. NMS7]
MRNFLQGLTQELRCLLYETLRERRAQPSRKPTLPAMPAAGVAIAYREWENRKRLDAIDKALEQIEAALIKVMPE